IINEEMARVFSPEPAVATYPNVPHLKSMTRPQTRERLLRWVAVPALAAVLVGLAVLQYRWSGQVSDATRAQMLGNLHVSLMGFRQDFAHELGAVAVEVRSVVERSSSMTPAERHERFHNLQQRMGHSNRV